MKLFLGIEFGSTRIKAVLIDESHNIISTGAFTWENQFVNGVWTYSLELAKEGLISCYKELKENYFKKYNKVLTRVDSIGVSAMMHGYLVFDKNDNQLAEFRTWRNTITQQASDILTNEFNFHIPQRWSIAHIYQAILNKEKEVKDIVFSTTLAGYFHYLFTGRKVLGIGEASGVFPIDQKTGTYNSNMVQKFDKLIENEVDWKILDIIPSVLLAGENAGYLTKEGSLTIDPTGDLEVGIPLCPPEGDMGTGMAATNSTRAGTGNCSIGTSSNLTVVTNADINLYREIDVIATPTGVNAALVHVNNGTNEINAWEKLFKEIIGAFKPDITDGEIYELLFTKVLEGDKSSKGLYPLCYLSGEPITKINEGKLLFIREPDSVLNLANFMRSQVYSLLATIRIGLDILRDQEKVVVNKLIGHGGFFKTPGVGESMLAAALNVSVATLSSASEGGPYGMALLSAYSILKEEDETLEDYLDNKVFSIQGSNLYQPVKEDVEGFDDFLEKFKKVLDVEKEAITQLK